MPFKLLWWCQTRHKSLSLSGSLMLQYINPPHTYIIHYIKLYIYYTLYYYHPRIGSMKHTDTSVNVESIHGHPMTFRFQLLSDLGHSREEALGPRSKIVSQIWLVVSWFICYVLKHVGKKPEVALFFCIFEEFGLPLSLAMETCSKPQDAKHVKNRIWVGTCFVWVRYFGTQLFLRFVLRFLSDLLMITVRCKRHKIWDDIFEPFFLSVWDTFLGLENGAYNILMEHMGLSENLVYKCI